MVKTYKIRWAEGANLFSEIVTAGRMMKFVSILENTPAVTPGSVTIIAI